MRFFAPIAVLTVKVTGTGHKSLDVLVAESAQAEQDLYYAPAIYEHLRGKEKDGLIKALEDARYQAYQREVAERMSKNDWRGYTPYSI